VGEWASRAARGRLALAKMAHGKQKETYRWLSLAKNHVSEPQASIAQFTSIPARPRLAASQARTPREQWASGGLGGVRAALALAVLAALCLLQCRPAGNRPLGC